MAETKKHIIALKKNGTKRLDLALYQNFKDGIYVEVPSGALINLRIWNRKVDLLNTNDADNGVASPLMRVQPSGGAAIRVGVSCFFDAATVAMLYGKQPPTYYEIRLLDGEDIEPLLEGTIAFEA